MSADPLVALQTALAELLLASPDLSLLVADRVFDPMSIQGQDTPYPYVEIGDDQAIGDSDQCSDRTEIYCNVHVWADGPSGGVTVKQIGAVIRDLLGQPFTLLGHDMLSALFFKSVLLTEADPANPDGILAHQALTFHYRTKPAS